MNYFLATIAGAALIGAIDGYRTALQAHAAIRAVERRLDALIDSVIIERLERDVIERLERDM